MIDDADIEHVAGGCEALGEPAILRRWHWVAPSETYAVTAYVLHLNGIVRAKASLDAKTLPRVRMPNRDGFVGDPRPDLPAHTPDSTGRRR